MANLRQKTLAIDKYELLSHLQNENETLFYSTVIHNLEEIMPLIYTPTVGEACQKFSDLYSGSRGLFLSLKSKGKVANVSRLTSSPPFLRVFLTLWMNLQVLKNWPQKDIKVIVVTDGERILGLGDLGANGMGIPIGKLSLYTACAGLRPENCLPVTIDAGTNNEQLLKDPHYIGMPSKRVRGKEYDEFLDEFMREATRLYPGVLIQFEDFGNANAFALLERYADKYCCFNDDMQGTASVAVSGILSGLRITRKALQDQRILFVGAGEAALGIADLTCFALEKAGLSLDDARQRCWFVDSSGLVESTRTNLSHHKAPFAHKFRPVRTLSEAVKALRPTVLIGVAGMGRMFTKEIVEDMCSFNERPMIFALSNPTSKAECTAEEAYTWVPAAMSSLS